MNIGYKRISEFFFCGLFLICLSVSAFSQNMFRKVNDFDGDGKADFAVTRDIDGLRYWYILQSTDGFRGFQWGNNTDQNAAGDYDGDGKTDIAIFRKEPVSPPIMRFSYWINGSQAGVMTSVTQTNNYPQSVSVQQDYDGDGKTDRAYTHQNGTVQIELSGGSGRAYRVYGIPIKIGDTNGDAKAEVAFYDENTQIIDRTYVDNTMGRQQISYGLAGDQFVAADFDGDGKGDLTVFRQSDGTWWWIRSSDNVVNAATFGTTGDVPVPADYDGDGKTDLRSGEAVSRVITGFMAVKSEFLHWLGELTAIRSCIIETFIQSTTN